MDVRRVPSRITSPLAAAVVATALSVAGAAHSAWTAAGPTPGGTARDAAVYALGLIGVVYRDGGDTPEGGFDCSGLTRHVLARTGVADLPRTAREQGTTGTPVQRDALRSGDLVFFDTQGSANSHVGIYIGEGRFVHAPGRGKSVALAQLASPYWQRHYNGARRHGTGNDPRDADAGPPAEADGDRADGRSWASPPAAQNGATGNLPIAPGDVR